MSAGDPPYGSAGHGPRGSGVPGSARALGGTGAPVTAGGGSGSGAGHTGGTGGAGGAGRLRRVARQAARRGADEPERCELCAQPLPADHRHLLRPATGTVSCACRACALLFGHGGTAGGRGYLALPDTRRRLDGCSLDDALWAALGIPVNLAFFTRSGEAGPVTAAYPSPLGAVRFTVDPDSWREVVSSHPALPSLAADVQALLVNRARGAAEHWLVPLDDCYRLVALVRAHWKGLGGGPEVWQRIDDFFRQLTALTTEEASWASP